MATLKKTHYRGVARAFTMIEIMVVLVILGIAALIAVPMMSSAADMQVRGAANRLAADLDYAKNMAITHQRSFTVVFDADNESYLVQNTDGTINNPLRPGTNFSVSFPAERSISRVQIVSADFVSSAGTEEAVTFDYLGTPYSGTTATEALNSGQIILRDTSGNFTLNVNVEPMTGYVTITP